MGAEAKWPTATSVGSFTPINEYIRFIARLLLDCQPMCRTSRNYSFSVATTNTSATAATIITVRQTAEPSEDHSSAVLIQFTILFLMDFHPFSSTSSVPSKLVAVKSTRRMGLDRLPPP